MYYSIGSMLFVHSIWRRSISWKDRYGTFHCTFTVKPPVTDNLHTADTKKYHMPLTLAQSMEHTIVVCVYSCSCML